MLPAREVKLIQLAISVLLCALITSCASTPPLWDAAKAGDTHTMQALLDKGADVNAKTKDELGWTAPVKPSENLTEAGVVASSENLTGDSGASGCCFPPGLSLGRPGDRRF